MNRFARFCLILAIFAVITRAMIPAGYMPETAAGKTFQMTICSMEGPKTITVDEKFHPVSGQHHAAKEICAFGILMHSPFNAVITAIVFDAPYVVAQQQKIIARDQFVRTTVFYSVAQPRAPPVIV